MGRASPAGFLGSSLGESNAGMARMRACVHTLAGRYTAACPDRRRQRKWPSLTVGLHAHATPTTPCSSRCPSPTTTLQTGCPAARRASLRTCTAFRARWAAGGDCDPARLALLDSPCQEEERLSLSLAHWLLPTGYRGIEASQPVPPLNPHCVLPTGHGGRDLRGAGRP